MHQRMVLLDDSRLPASPTVLTTQDKPGDHVVGAVARGRASSTPSASAWRKARDDQSTASMTRKFGVTSRVDSARAALDADRRVGVNQAGHQHAVAQIDDLDAVRRRRWSLADFGDLAVFDADRARRERLASHGVDLGGLDDDFVGKQGLCQPENDEDREPPV